jgi:hypothetical protein
MAVMFSHPAWMHKGGDFKTTKKGIHFALKLNRCLRLGDNAGMVHLSSFLLILLCFLPKPLKSKDRAFEVNSLLNQEYSLFVAPSIHSRQLSYITVLKMINMGSQTRGLPSFHFRVTAEKRSAKTGFPRITGLV